MRYDHHLATLLCAAAIAMVFTACHGRDLGPAGVAPILLFSGRGTSPGDVAAVEKVLSREHLEYSSIGTGQLNRLTELEIRRYRLLIVPGGNFEQIGKSLTPAAEANIRDAVRSGLNYLGICAGAFFAGNSRYNGLNLTSGAGFGFYAAEARGIRKSAVAITDAGGQTLDQYWEDGPQLTGWGAVVARYPKDGRPRSAHNLAASPRQATRPPFSEEGRRKQPAGKFVPDLCQSIGDLAHLDDLA